ncbi:hypothetical protein NA57DRAFT_54604 [Rhizodiscina lignyota]|uniref:Mediator of RNA polymerase II transcription subunit 22 n=1 Tax=Rhizodiscina lignyota TaxID=1504668 RepID=A0A9P4IJ25_9PEZI|nr:hypothetical protein NA57DRAFT_54604 [Rhizodiscina lignyota]
MAAPPATGAQVIANIQNNPRENNSLRSGEDLDKRITQLVRGLISPFQNLLELGIVKETDLNSTAQVGYQMEVETALLIRNAENILTLTRQMQELWLRGHLETLKKDGANEKTEENVKAVAKLIDELIQKRDSLVQGSEEDKES